MGRLSLPRGATLGRYACTLAVACAPLLAGAQDGAAGGGKNVGNSGDWPMPAHDLAGTRYSPLAQITAANVKDLRVAWTFSTGVLHGHEAAPIVVGDTMYVVTPYPNILYALDLAHDGALKWTYKPKPARAAQGVACCDVVNRGAVYADGKVIFNTLDDFTVAVDAASGKEVWKTQLGEINRGETMTMAPLVVKDKVLVGNSGGEMGVRGWLTALDLATGKVAWRAYSTGPDKDVLIGPDFKPPYPNAQGPDLGARTWPNDAAWKVGGGSVWGWITYDPQADLLYYGTSNPGPWNSAQRPGDNKWTATLFARRPGDGHAQWAVQLNPHDLYDYDGINESVLLDLKVDGQDRRLLAHPDRNGYLYVMDRLTGKIVNANAFAAVNTVQRIDLASGLPVPNPAKNPEIGKMVKDICPAAPGGKDWQPIAWSPRTQLLYVPHNNLCMDMQIDDVGYIAGTPYIGAKVAMRAGPGGHRGAFSAYDPVKGREVWSLPEPFPAWSGALATAGDVVFYGTMDRWFKAVDAKSGKLLWQFRAPSGIIGQPISYRGPDGKQYVAVLAGVGGWSGGVVAGGLDTRVPYGALGMVGAMTDLGDATAQGGTLMVFALP
jgi:alcohol dehydrogenase (cytochrome c)